jgi:O-antigen/teichoic acid export membrane protein
VSLRSLARASALYTVGNILPKIGAFLLLPIYVGFLSPAQYGALALLTSVSAVLTLVYRLGLDSALMRVHFDVADRERPGLYSTLTLGTIGLTAGLSLVAALILGPLFPVLFSGIPFWPLGALSLLIAALATIQYVPSVLFRATGQASRFLALNLGYFVLGSALSVVLVVGPQLGTEGALLGQLGGVAWLFVVTLWIVHRQGPWTFDAAALRSALRLGTPLVPHSVAAWALRMSDRWLLGVLLTLPALASLEAIGAYSLGYQIGYAVTILVVSFNAAWSPYFFRVGNLPSGPAMYRSMVTIVIAGLLAVAVAMAALAPEIIQIMATPRYAAAADVLPIIAFASVIQGLYTMLVSVVFLMKRTGRLAILTVLAAAANVGANVVLVPPLGIVGAAWATIIGYTLLAAGTYLVARSSYPLHLEIGWLVGLGVAALAAVATAVLVGEASDGVAQGVGHVAVALLFGTLAAGVILRGLTRLRVAAIELGPEGMVA